MKATHLTIGLLSLAAFAMALVIVLLPPNTRPAYADNVGAGDYRLVTATENPDCVTVMNTREGKMLVYQLSGGAQQKLLVVGRFDLALAFNGPAK